MAWSDDLDIQDLLDLARDRSIESRTQLTQIVGDLFFDGRIVLTDRERSLMSDILRQLIHDVDVTVRRMLAERFAAEPEAPAELINTLANDRIEVAYPILVKSPVLQDIDLIEIIWHRTQQHQLAIASRGAISEQVSDALVETGEVDVITTLLENRGAEISQATKEYLVERSQYVNEFQDPLLHRHDLGVELAQRMYWWVSAALREYIVEHFDVDPMDLEERIEGTIAEIASEREAPEARTKSQQLASKVKARNGITPKLLTDALRQGEVHLFEDLFAEFTQLSKSVIRHLIYRPGGEGLAVACRSAGMGKADFTAVFLLSRSARPGDKNVDTDELDRVMKFYDSVTPETAAQAVRRWRLDPKFQRALEDVSSRPPAPEGD